MDRPFLEGIEFKDFLCLKDTKIQLSPLHALIGPNDSGKSTVVRGILALGHLFGMAPMVGTYKSPFLAGLSNKAVRINATFTDLMFYGFPGPPQVLTGRRLIWPGDPAVAMATHRDYARCLLLRLDPDDLRQPTHLIQHDKPLVFQSERGLGLPGIYDAILTRDTQAYLAIVDEVRRLFPSVKSLRLFNVTQQTKSMGITLSDGTEAPAELMSEGLLYYLAFAALKYLDPPGILLIEEPENGLHPARIAEVMRVLREISKTTQVIIATHSPLVINELEGHEITVLSRDPVKGTRAMLLKDTPNFEARSQHYALGELWVSYADGDQETALIDGGPRP